MMTEAQARMCWCPFARSAAQGQHTDVVQNRDTDGRPDTGCKCLGSACMAWRWTIPPQAAVRDGGDGTGYCGLAGPVRA